MAFDPTPTDALELLHRGRPKLSFRIAQNDSDMTVGWNGQMAGFKVSYGAQSGHTVFRENHAVQLSGTIVPTVAVQYVERSFLNYPFTECIPTESLESMKPFNPPPYSIFRILPRNF